MTVETHARAIVAALTIGALTRKEIDAMFTREEMGDQREAARAIRWARDQGLIAHGNVSRGCLEGDVVKAWYVTYKGKSWLSSLQEGASL